MTPKVSWRQRASMRIHCSPSEWNADTYTTAHTWRGQIRPILGYRPPLKEYERYRVSDFQHLTKGNRLTESDCLTDYADFLHWATEWEYKNARMPWAAFAALPGRTRHEAVLSYADYVKRQVKAPTSRILELTPTSTSALVAELTQQYEMWREAGRTSTQLTFYLYLLAFGTAAFFINFLSGRTQLLLAAIPTPGMQTLGIIILSAAFLVGVFGVFIYKACLDAREGLLLHARAVHRLHDVLIGFPTTYQLTAQDIARLAVIGQLAGDETPTERAYYRSGLPAASSAALGVVLGTWLFLIVGGGYSWQATGRFAATGTYVTYWGLTTILRFMALVLPLGLAGWFAVGYWSAVRFRLFRHSYVSSSKGLGGTNA